MKTKFRGKDKDTGEWRYGDLVHKDLATCIGLNEFCYTYLGRESTDYNTYEVHPESVGQWTGKCDKNSVDVYQHDTDIRGFTVVWDDADASFYLDGDEMHCLYECEKWLELSKGETQ